jgi:peptidoglycan-N-acetylglucosamine deacetylase
MNMHLPTTKEILITIDDSPGPASHTLLDLLRELEIKAAMFCVGAQLEQHSSVAERAVAEGHLLGNHSYSHAWYSKLAVSEIIADIDRADSLIEEVYRTVGVARPIRAFRYPFGDKGIGNSRFKMPLRHYSQRFRAVQRHLAEKGYAALRWEVLAMHAPLSWCRTDIDWSWTCDLKEFNFPASDDITRKLNVMLQRPGRDVLLLHDHPDTSEPVCRILQAMAARDVEFVDPTFAAI